MTYRIRPFDLATDMPRLVEFANMLNPEPVTLAMMQEFERRAPEGRVRHIIAAVDESDYIVGGAQLERMPWMPEGRFYGGVIVDPAYRGRGIAAMIYEEIVRLGRESGLQEWQAQVKDDLPGALAFAEHRGFKVTRHIFESTLDLTAFDPSPFAGTVEQLEAEGIRFVSLADLGDTEEAQRKYYELHCKTTVDIPGMDWTIPPFEEMQKNWFQGPNYRADGVGLALDGDRFIGLAALRWNKQARSSYNMFTAVDKEYRGRRLALALKLVAVKKALEWGAVVMRTNNDSMNAPMLAVNRKMGFVPVPGFYKVLGQF